MLITCQFCTTRIQLDETKLPAHAFSVRCPQCRKAITIQLPGASLPQTESPPGGIEAKSLSPSATPAITKTLDGAHLTPAVAAPPPSSSTSPNETADLVRALTLLLQNNAQAEARRAPEKLLKVLVCAAHSDPIAQSLAAQGYQADVAADAVQALERLRRDALDVVVLDADFDAKGQGAVFVTRAIGGLPPFERRQLFVVQLTAASQSGDAHQAFLHSANLIVHPDDLAQLPQLIENARRDYDELYRLFRAVTSDK